MIALLRPALVCFAVLGAATGIAYPLAVTGMAWIAFPDQAAGSLILRDGKPVGSSLIGQNFSDPKYVWGRPSATGPMPYNASNSGGSNLGPLNPALADAVKGRIEALREADRGLVQGSADQGLAQGSADPGNATPVPVDLVTASGSGLDPHISVAAALYQAARVAKARRLPVAQVRQLIEQHTEGPLFGILGEPRVEVLQLNLALDAVRR